MTRIAIIGAGMAGLTLAKELNQEAEIQVFEKSRGYGGRMAMRMRNAYQFDHGAQFFTARSAPFNRLVETYIEAGVVARWDARFVEMERDNIVDRRQWTNEPPHYVAVPGMSSLAESMGQELPVQLNTSVEHIVKDGTRWQLTDDGGNSYRNFDWVILAIPAAQAAALLPGTFQYSTELVKKNILGCYSLMLGFPEPLALDWDAALVREADISWACNNNSKPGRPDDYTLLVHSTNSWAETNMELDKELVIRHLMQETRDVIGQDIDHVAHIDLHRWRYANINKQEGQRSYLDEAMQLGAIGDWCIKGRIESAYLSGLHAAEHLRQLLSAYG